MIRKIGFVVISYFTFLSEKEVRLKIEKARFSRVKRRKVALLKEKKQDLVGLKEGKSPY